MKKKVNLNEAFYNNYMEVDRLCSAKFGVMSGGVSNYIDRLTNSRFASNREDVLKRLIKYRDVKRVLCKEGGLLSATDGVCRADVRWLKDFAKDLVNKQDPLFKYLRRSRAYVTMRKTVIAFLIIAVIGVGAALAAYFLGYLG